MKQGVVQFLTLKIDDPEQLKRIEVGDRVKGVLRTDVAMAVVPA